MPEWYINLRRLVGPDPARYILGFLPCQEIRRLDVEEVVTTPLLCPQRVSCQGRPDDDGVRYCMVCRLCVMINRDHLRCLQWLSLTYRFNLDEVSTMACHAAKTGKLKYLRWLQEDQDQGLPRAVWETAAATGRLDVLRWLYDGWEQHSDERRLWLSDWSEPAAICEDVCNAAAYHGRFRTLRWLQARHPFRWGQWIDEEVSVPSVLRRVEKNRNALVAARMEAYLDGHRRRDGCDDGNYSDHDDDDVPVL